MTLIESRDAQFGALAGVDFAEGFVIREPVLRPHLLRQWSAGERLSGDRDTKSHA
jgi:hypothetical protein